MHLKTIKTISVVFLSLFAIYNIWANNISIVKDGKAEAIILLDKKPTRSAQLGAFELQHHIKLITNCVIPITDKVDNIKANQVVIKVGGENANLPYETFKVKFSKNKILLTGYDTKDYRKVDYSKSGTFPSPLHTSNGSLYAVYDFLENSLGVRFYYPSPDGTTYKKQKSLTVNSKGKDKVFTPKMDAFRYIYIDDQKFLDLKPRDIVLWRLRWRQSQQFALTNHNQYSIYYAHWGKAKNPKLAKAFKKQNKALFAKGYEGKFHATDGVLRQNYPTDVDLPPQLCYSNLDTAKFYANEANIFYNGKNTLGGWGNFVGRYPTNQTILPRIEGKPWFYPVQGGDTGGYCRCKDCVKLFPKDSVKNLSNTKFHFIAQTAKELQKINPKAGISTLAYISTLSYPDKVELPSNVSVQICLPIYSWWHPIAEKLQLAAYNKWIEKEAKKRPLTLWTYLFGPRWDARLHHGDYLPFPGVYHHQTGKMFKKFAADGIRGWFSELELRYHALEAYIAARICYDPSTDPEKIISEYFNDMYGKAAPEMRAFYDELEKAYWNKANAPANWLKNPNKVIGPRGELRPYWTTSLHSPDINWQLGTKERMEKLNVLITKASKKLSTPEEKLRFERVLKYLWKPALQGKKDYENFKLSRKTKPKELTITRIANANGDPNKVDWSKAVKIENWQKVLGGADTARCVLRLAADKDYLYLHFYDPAGLSKIPQMIWLDDFEIFFATKKDYPVYQLALTPKTQTISYKRFRVEESEVSRTWNSGAKVIHSTNNNTWKALISIPLKNLPYNGKELYVNFFRSRPQGSIAWTPIYNKSYSEGRAYSGKINFNPFTVEESNFSLLHNGAGIITDKEAKNGKAAWMNSSKGWALKINQRKVIPQGKYQVQVNVRTDVPSNKNSHFIISLYNYTNKKTTNRVTINANKISGKKYHTVNLGVIDFKDNTELVVSALRPKIANTKLYFDSFTFTKVEKKSYTKDTTVIPVVKVNKEKKVIPPRNRTPYQGINWNKIIRVPGTTHRHTHARTQNVIDYAAAQGIEFFTLSNYHPSVPLWPLKGGTKRDFIYRQRGYVHNGKWHDKEINWNDVIAKYAHTLPKETQAKLPLRAPEAELRLPDNVIEAPNAEFHNFSNVSYLIHVNAPGSVFSAGHFDLRNEFKLKEHGYQPGCRIKWQEAFKLMLERLIVPDGGGITINHPAWSYAKLPLMLEMLDFDPRVLGIEVYNHSSGVADHNAWSEREWDDILATGRQCFGFFVPDHPGANPVWHGRNIMLVNEKTSEACLKALRLGNWYGAINDRPLKFTKIEMKDDTLTVETDKKALLLVISAKGVVRRVTGKKVTFSVTPESRKSHIYLRVTATEPVPPTGMPQKLFTQPFMLLNK